MRFLSVVAALLWSLAALANGGLVYVAVRYGDEPLDWFVAPLLVAAPILAAVGSIAVPLRLRYNGRQKPALRAAQIAFLLALCGLVFEVNLFQSR